EHGRRWFQPGLAAFDVEKLLGPEIRAEASFGNDIIGKFQPRSRRQHRIATVRDVCKRASVHERGRAFERLHEIGLERLLEERGHGAGRIEVRSADRSPVSRPADDHAPELFLKLLEARRKAESGHDFGSDGNVETILAREAVASAKPYN